MRVTVKCRTEAARIGVGNDCVPNKFGHLKKCSVEDTPRAPTDVVRCPSDAGSSEEVRKEYPEIQKNLAGILETLVFGRLSSFRVFMPALKEEKPAAANC
jgi:hypothetical protein